MLSEILGFVVLTGPLLLMVLWLAVCIWLAWKLTKRHKAVAVRIVVGVLVFALLVLAPIADEIVGRAYFNHLCATEAGVKVYKTVELPADYWDEQGRPRFLEENGNFHLGNAYPIEHKTEMYSATFHVENLGYQLMNG
jgi:uncharacterized membrane protein